MIKTAIAIGGAYFIGGAAGGKIADAVGVKSEYGQGGIKIATGLVALVLISSIIR
jgi:hypothetical protein